MAQEEMSYKDIFSFSPGSLAASLFWVAERFVQFWEGLLWNYFAFESVIKEMWFKYSSYFSSSDYFVFGEAKWIVQFLVEGSMTNISVKLI